MRLPPRYMVHAVTVEPLTGTGPYGDVYGPAFTLQCMAQGKRRLVRNSQGAEVLSSLTLYAALGASASVPEGSKVTWRGDTSKVIATTEHDDANLGAPQHCEVACE